MEGVNGRLKHMTTRNMWRNLKYEHVRGNGSMRPINSFVHQDMQNLRV